MKGLSPILTSVIALTALLPSIAAGGGAKQPIVFATFAGDSSSVSNVLILAESIRTFGGAYKNAPIWVYTPPGLIDRSGETGQKFAVLDIDVKSSKAPEDAAWFFFAGKVFASAEAESAAEGTAHILAWLDEDTIVLQEPGEFLLPEERALGYRPVMHRNVGVLYDEPLNEFWGRAFELLAVPGTSLFPMVTPADADTIRPYFNAGCMVVRPERRLLAEWTDCFRTLYRDSLLTEMCRADVKKRIFIHQVALAGAILRHIERDEMLEFSARINYPIFFEQMFGAKRKFDDITDVVTFRHESYFRKPEPGWDKKLKGPSDRIAWIKKHLDVQGR